jgi:hypothetical protein
VPESASHPASLATDHEHSRFVSMRSVPDPPAAGNADDSGCACTPHLAGDGDGVVTVLEAEPHDSEKRMRGPLTTAHTKR